MGDIGHTNEMCKNYLSTYISSTTTTIGDDVLATDIQNYESSDNVEYLERDQEKPQQITKSSMHPLDKNTNLPQNEGMLI